MQLTRYSGFGPLGWSAALITVSIASPIIVIAASIFVTGSVDILGHLANTVLGTYVANSLMLAIGVGVMTLLIGVPAALVYKRLRFPRPQIFCVGNAAAIGVSCLHYCVCIYRYSGLCRAGIQFYTRGYG